MSEREILRLFHRVEHDRGLRYVEARDRLVEQGEAIRAFLERQRGDPDWMRVQAAEVILGWIDHHEQYELCAGYFSGRVVPPFDGTPLDGDSRIPEQIHAMYPTIVPRLIEILLKTHEVPYDSRRYGPFIQSILPDPRFREPLAAAMLDETRPLLERIDMARALQDHRDPRTVEFARDLAWNPRVDRERRMSGFGILAVAGAREELPRIRRVLEDPDVSESTLELFVRAAQYFEDRESLDLLLAILRRAQRPSLRSEILLALSTIRDPRALPDVQRVVEHDPDPVVRRRARNTVMSLQDAAYDEEQGRNRP